MLFNSYTFVFFFLIVYTAYLSLQRYRTGQNLLLLAASYVFYGWWDWRFLGLLAVSTGIDFLIARKVHQLEQVQAQTVVSGSRRQLGTRPLDVQARRRQLLGISIASNLVILGFFKYFNFFADSMVTFLGMFGLDPSYSTLQIVLPEQFVSTTYRRIGLTVLAVFTLVLLANVVVWFYLDKNTDSIQNVNLGSGAMRKKWHMLENLASPCGHANPWRFQRRSGRRSGVLDQCKRRVCD